MASGEESLERVLGVKALTLCAINLCVGAGIVGLPSAVAAELGGYAFIAYLFCGAVISLVLLCFAEAGSRVVTAGGPYMYGRIAFGPFVGGVTGIVWVLAQGVISGAAIVMLMIEMLTRTFPALGDRMVQGLVLFAIYASLAVLHIRWARAGVGATVALTVIKLVPLLLVASGFLWKGLPPGLLGGPVPSGARVGHGALILFFAFMGIETALNNGSEIRDPARTVPRAVIIAVTGITLLYLAIHLAAEKALGADLPAAGGAALPLTARAIFGPWAEVVVGIGVIVSMAALTMGDIFASPRVPFALGRDGVLPRVLGRVHPAWHTPYVAIAAYAMLGFAIALSGTFRQLAILGVSGTLFCYMVTALGVLRMRRRGVADAGTPFVIPGGPLVPLAACVLIICLLVSLDRKELVALGGLIGFAVAVSWWTQVFRLQRKGTPAA